MKENLFIILTIFLIVLVIVGYIYYNYEKKLTLASNANKEYEKYIQEEITGADLMTLINKVSDQNEKNEIQKNTQNRYIENEENSIKVAVKFLESKKTYEMEAITKLGSEAFVKNYSKMQFKCKKVEYHEKTQKIKYMLFEQI